MRRPGLTSLATAILMTGALALPSPILAQAGPQNLGAVNIHKDTIANGQPLPKGSYTVRAADLPVKPVVGQTPSEYRWVEFVQDGAVKGREIAVVLSGAPATQVIKGRAPKPGAVRVETLRGNDSVRVWINRGGQHYFVHLATTATPVH